MKKLIPIIMAGITVVSCTSITAGAAGGISDATDDDYKKSQIYQNDYELPFALSAPENVSLTYLEGNDSLNTCEIHYSQSNDMSSWSSRKNDEHETVIAELGEMGYDDVWINAQIDWSLDSEDDWKCNDYWLSDGYDENGKQHLGEWAYISQSYSDETSMNEWIFRYMGNIDDPADERWYGSHDGGNDYNGWGDVLKEGQYKVKKTDDESLAWIDLSEHTMYVRVRWIVTARPLEGEDIKIVSDWSQPAAAGKDAEKAEPLKLGDIAPPQISDLRYLDDEMNGYPVIGFKLDVSPELAAQAAQVNGTQGTLRLYTYAKVEGSQNWAELQGNIEIEAGDIWISLQNIAEIEGKIEKDTPIQLRAKFYCSQAGQEDFYSEFSDIITFGAVDMEVTTAVVTEDTAETTNDVTTAATETKKKKKCSVCGICPQIFGVCIFIVIAVVVVIVLASILIPVAITMKKKKKSESGTDDGQNDAPETQQPEQENTERSDEPENNEDSGKNA